MPFGIVIDDHLQRTQHGHGAGHALVQVLALEVLQHFDVGGTVGARGSDGGAEVADCLRGEAAAADAGQSRHARIVPAIDAIFLHQLQQLALAEQRVGEVEAVKLDLLRGEDSELLDEPLVEWLMVGELQRTHGVCDLFERIRLAVGVVVHRDRCTTCRRCGDARRAGCDT